MDLMAAITSLPHYSNTSNRLEPGQMTLAFLEVGHLCRRQLIVTRSPFLMVTVASEHPCLSSLHPALCNKVNQQQTVLVENTEKQCYCSLMDTSPY